VENGIWVLQVDIIRENTKSEDEIEDEGLEILHELQVLSIQVAALLILG